MIRLRYDPSLSYDSGQGGLRIRYAVKGGIIEYSFVHSVAAEKNCDVWRMSIVNALDEKGEFLHPLTKKNAEWEMAIRLKGRPDFIGGFNHGDEVGELARLTVDGKQTEITSLSQWRDAHRVEITVDSIGFDPASPKDKVLSHRKEYVFDAEGVHLSQRVTWLTAVVLETKLRSYLAMMPPLKHDPQNAKDVLTDSFAFGSDPISPITSLPQEARDTKRICVQGKKGYAFTMSVENYAPLYPNSYLALLTDNGNCNYHKMYVSFGGGREDEIFAGTVWVSETHYQIEKK